jgi:hypothetical protein
MSVRSFSPNTSTSTDLRHTTDTLKFVDEVFAKYAPKPTPTAAATTSIVADSPGYSPPRSPIPIEPYHGLDRVQEAKANDVGYKHTRKRPYREFSGQTGVTDGGSRASKSSRLGRGARERNKLPRSQYPSPASQPTAFHMQPFSKFPRPPTPPPGFPAFDPADPMSSFMAMQAMFPHITSTTSTSNPNSRPNTIQRQRCQDYDTRGFCVRGSSCPFDHGNDHIVASGEDEYDPTNAIIDTNGHHGGLSSLQKGPTQSQGDVRNPTRAAFSDHRVPHDRNITAIVIEQIPEEYFNEHSVRGFFSQFGNITDITLQAYKHLAIVKYDTRSAAQRAWQSPKAIFDNRFVKVYWYRPDLDMRTKSNGTASNALLTYHVKSSASPGLMTAEEIAEYKRRQEEKQQAHERRQDALRKTEEAKQALIRRKEEVTKQYEAEREVLKARLAAKGEELPMEEVSSEALALREQLARLEAEAIAMGIDPNGPADESPYTRRGRGGARGYSSRGGYSGRGRGYTPYQPTRGSYRGSPFVRGRSSAVRKLDNRPRKIAISGRDFTPQKEEMLKAYLVSVGEFESIERDPERTDTFVVSFRERWQAEQVMNGQTDVLGVGKVNFAWVASAPMTTTELPVPEPENEAMGDAPNGHSHDMRDDIHQELEVNFDVAGGDDEWDNIS